MTVDDRSIPAVIGTARRDGDTATVRMESVYDTDIDDLWSAITEPDRVARWIAEVSGDLRQGGTFDIAFVSTWTGRGTVRECERPNRLLLEMDDLEGGGNAELQAMLTAEGDRTRLVIEESGFGLDEVLDHGAGWQAHVEDLHAYLDGTPRTEWHQRWTELRPVYEERGVEGA